MLPFFLLAMQHLGTMGETAVMSRVLICVVVTLKSCHWVHSGYAALGNKAQEILPVSELE